jgi:hypothetical protein
MFKPLGGSLTQEVICLTGKCTFLANATMDTTSGSTTVGIADSTVLSVGDGVNATGIPAGATVVSIESATSMTISAAATATGTNKSDGLIALQLGSAGFAIGAPTGTGLQLITLTDAYNSFLGATVTYVDSSLSGSRTTGSEIESETVATTKLINVQHFAADGGGGQTFGSLSGKTAHYMIWVKNSSV